MKRDENLGIRFSGQYTNKEVPAQPAYIMQIATICMKSLQTFVALEKKGGINHQEKTKIYSRIFCHRLKVEMPNLQQFEVSI